MTNILVTGGAGFIGSNFIRILLQENTEYKIVNLDALTYAGNSATIAEFAKNLNYRFVWGDIADQEFVEKLLSEEKIELIVNFAAESFVDKSIQNTKPFIDSNVQGVRSLLDASRKIGIKKFLQISTDEVYGSTADGVFTEESLLKPRNPYSASKTAADHIVGAYNVTYGMPVLITRSSNNYGPYQYPE